MPQFDFSTFPSQIFWLVITFVALYFALGRTAIP
jgi:F-type H+-transporting ATPase subunit b